MKKLLFLMLIAMAIVTSVLAAATLEISWNANPEPDMAAYKVYEGTNLIGTVQHPTTLFTITGVPDGTWIYYLTAIDTAGNESLRSVGASITLDSVPPGKPAGIKVRIKN